MMHKGFLKMGSMLGALTVILGAFGAHALKAIAGPQQQNIFETAVRYQFYHVFALLLAGVLFKEYTNKYIVLAGRLFMIGMLLFSGSLYLLCFVQIWELQSFKWLGPITPVGGLVFILAWLCMLMGVIKQR